MAIKPDKVSKMIFRFDGESDSDEHPGTDGRDADDLQVHDYSDYDMFRDIDDDDVDDDDHGSRSGDVYDSPQYDSGQNEDNGSLQEQSDILALLDDVSESHSNESAADPDIMITSSPVTMQLPPMPIEQNTNTTLTAPPTAAVQYEMLMKEVQKSNELIKGLYDRLKKTEEKVKDIDIQMQVSRKGKHPAKRQTPVRIPDDVKKEVKRMYKLLVDKGTLPAWDVQQESSWPDRHNQEVLAKLIEEVRTSYGYKAEHIKVVAQRHYKTQREEESKKRRGVHGAAAVTKRRRGRSSRKLECRKYIFDCLDIPKEKREKWAEVLKLEYMSSEDSGEEDTLVVRPIPWLSKKVEEFKTFLDAQRSKDMSAQSRRQAKQKVRGTPSTRLRPSGGSGWIFKIDID